MFEFGAKFYQLARFNLILLIVALCTDAGAQPVSAIPARFYPGSYSRSFTDAFSVAGNPASLASYKLFIVGLHAEQKFMLAGLSHFTLAAGCPLKGGGAGMLFNYFTSGILTRSEIGIAYSKQLGAADLGLKFNYHQVMIPGYGRSAAIVFDVATIWHITDAVHAGVHLYNPVGGRFKNGQQLNYQYKCGLGYEVSTQVLLCTEILKEEGLPVNINAGMLYQPVPKLTIQAGIATASAQPFAGVSMQWHQYRLGISVTGHAQLGISPALSLVFISGKRPAL